MLKKYISIFEARSFGISALPVNRQILLEFPFSYQYNNENPCLIIIFISLNYQMNGFKAISISEV